MLHIYTKDCSVICISHYMYSRSKVHHNGLHTVWHEALYSKAITENKVWENRFTRYRMMLPHLYCLWFPLLFQQRIKTMLPEMQNTILQACYIYQYVDIIYSWNFLQVSNKINGQSLQWLLTIVLNFIHINSKRRYQYIIW